MTVTINGTTGINVNGVSGNPFLGNVQFLTTDKTLTSADDKDLLVCSNTATVTLPAVSEGLSFGFVNGSDGEIVIKTPNASTLVGRQSGGILLGARGEAIVVCDGVGWQVIGAPDTFRIKTVQFSASGTYVPAPGAKLFLACVTGATGGTYAVNGQVKGGVGGGGYSEKLYIAPFSASYAVTIGAGGAAASSGGTLPGGNGGTTTFGTISIPGSAGGPTSGAGTSGATGTGGDFNATGGNGAAGDSQLYSNGRGGGGGGAASRAGNGGNGTAANSPVYGAGAGGGTGGNNASQATGGAAATSVSGSAYGLTAFYTSVLFSAGNNALGTDGGNGASSYTLYSGNGDFVIGAIGAGAGVGGPSQSFSYGYSGQRGHITIVEIF